MTKKTVRPYKLQAKEDSKPKPATSQRRQQAQANYKSKKTASANQLQAKEDRYSPGQQPAQKTPYLSSVQLKQLMTKLGRREQDNLIVCFIVILIYLVYIFYNCF